MTMRDDSTCPICGGFVSGGGLPFWGWYICDECGRKFLALGLHPIVRGAELFGSAAPPEECRLASLPEAYVGD